MVKLNKLGIHVPDTKGFNSGVLLMNLRRMREQELAVSLVLQANKKLQPAWPDPQKVNPAVLCPLDCACRTVEAMEAR
jgi:lipopolysaccharide biosynthesis glycosyltransferase